MERHIAPRPLASLRCQGHHMSDEWLQDPLHDGTVCFEELFDLVQRLEHAYRKVEELMGAMEAARLQGRQAVANMAPPLRR